MAGPAKPRPPRWISGTISWEETTALRVKVDSSNNDFIFGRWCGYVKLVEEG